jgi:amino acid adenylation domain-containing protein
MEREATVGFWLSPQQASVCSQQAAHPAVAMRAVGLVALEGRVRPEALQRALRELSARHEILRTVYRRQPGMKLPFQVVLDSLEPAWEVLRLPAMSLAEREQALQRLFEQEQRRKTDLAQGPVLHATLIELDEEHAGLLLGLPAICADARSLDILGRELGELYAGQPHANGTNLRYVQFAQWQKDLLESQEESAQQGRQFWQSSDSSGSVLALPDQIRSAEAGIEPKIVRSDLSAATVSCLHALAERQSASMADVLLACFQSLLVRLGGQYGVGLHVVLDGRGYEELEDTVGLIAKPVPMACRASAEMRFDELIQSVRDATQQVNEWQEYADPCASHPSIVFSYRDLPERASQAGVWFEWLEQQVHAEGFELKLSAQRRGDRIELLWHYDGGRVAGESVQRYAGYFQTLLLAALEDPARSVSRLPVLPAGERQRLLIEWNQSAREYPRQCLQELFEAQVARTPDRPAVRCGEQVLSYRELNERANQLAHHLRTLGVGADSLVGLAVQRSAETMLAVLGILKAGGAYVPLSPDSPRARLEQQLSGVAVLLSEQSLLAQLPQFCGQRICLDRDQRLWAEHSRSNPPLLNTPEDLIYVIYTSGSTGVPKGVAVRHRNLTNYAHFITERLELARFPEGLHFASVSTIGADLGNTCIFPALISGGCLHIIAYEDCTDAQRFARYAQRYPIDVLKIVPSHLQALLSSAEAQQLLPREYLIMGGEALNPPLLERIAALGPRCRILNHYGPTETTVGSLTLKLDQWQGGPGAGSIPIGRPIANTQIYILDAHREPVPIGVSGELYIAGAGVTAGYLNQPQQSAERFLANPFSADPASRMYRTGDLARYGSDGNVEFLGRSDDQIKIRGFRIELGEIESVLMRHPAIQQALALAQEDQRGEKRLLAYFVAAREHTVSVEALREHLRAQLPDYMVPAAIIALPKIPLTANGKLDRNALPTPEQVQHTAQVAPSTATEEVVAAIWSELLHRENISTTDNFFELGGHSLMATQVISRIREHFHVELAMRVIFESPTIQGVSQAVETARALGEDLDEDDAIVPVSREAYFHAGGK